MLDVQGLALGFGSEPLLEGIEFKLESGELLVIRGANGVGKSTLLQALAGLQHPIAGEISLDGKKVSQYLNQAEILLLGHELGITPELTLAEQVQRLALFYGIDSVELEDFYLTGLEDLPVSHLSAGQKRRLWLSILDQFQGKLMLLDEPFLALDKDARILLERVIDKYIARKNGVVVIVTHLHESVKFCSQEIELSHYLPQNF